MATSSITDNFTICDRRAAGAFADAIFRASAATHASRRVKVSARRVAGRDAMRAFLSSPSRTLAAEKQR